MPPSGHTTCVSVGRTERTGPTFTGACELKIAAESGDAAVDDLFVDDVGLVDAPLGKRLGRVLDLDRQRRAFHRETRRIGQTGQRRGRVHRQRGRRGRRGRSSSEWSCGSEKRPIPRSRQRRPRPRSTGSVFRIPHNLVNGGADAVPAVLSRFLRRLKITVCGSDVSALRCSEPSTRSHPTDS